MKPEPEQQIQKLEAGDDKSVKSDDSKASKPKVELKDENTTKPSKQKLTDQISIRSSYDPNASKQNSEMKNDPINRSVSNTVQSVRDAI